MPEALRQLVVNADDLGMTRGINRAISEAHRTGILTSASLLANGAAFQDAVVRLRQCPDLSVGLHVNLTQGRPLRSGTKSSLVDRRGCFYARGALAMRLSIGAVSMGDLEGEIAAQAQWAVRAGITLTHFDSHENVHLHPLVASALAKVARRMNVGWIRFRDQRPVLPPLLREAGLLRLSDHARHLVVMLGSRLSTSGDSASQARRWVVGAPQLFRASPRHLFGALVRSIEGGVTEWVCHPGYADEELRALLPAAQADWREAELKVLTDPDCSKLLEAAGIGLVSYAQLAD
jgi:chitin disaccharide deacetylase